MEKSPIYSFVQAEANIKCLKERKEQLLQYNLDNNLKFTKFRFTGSVPKTSTDYDQLLYDLFTSPSVLKAIEVSGSPSVNMAVESQQMKLTVTNMGFFDKLEESG